MGISGEEEEEEEEDEEEKDLGWQKWNRGRRRPRSISALRLIEFFLAGGRRRCLKVLSDRIQKPISNTRYFGLDPLGIGF